MNDLALYNEIDEFAADWLENLIRAGHIAPGIVDRRSVLDLTPDDCLRYRQVHLFAGIGIWSASMRDAGIRDDERWWSASCPCQPFSQAGQGGGFDDERHLWPAAYHLISQCRPPKVAGEQVASPDGLHWIDLVSADMEGAGYAFGASDLCAAGVAVSAGETEIGQATVEWVRGAIQSCPDPFLAAELRDYAEWFGGQVGIGAPHIRQRLYWLADADCGGGKGRSALLKPDYHVNGCATGAVADTDGRDASAEGLQRGGQHGQPQDGFAVQLADATGRGQPVQRGASEPGRERYADSSIPVDLLGNPDDARSQGRIERGHGRDQRTAGPSGMAFWSVADWIICTDGQARPVEIGTFPLAHGERSRVGKLRAYGNQICRPLATEFLIAARQAVMTADRLPADLVLEHAGVGR